MPRAPSPDREPTCEEVMKNSLASEFAKKCLRGGGVRVFDANLVPMKRRPDVVPGCHRKCVHRLGESSFHLHIFNAGTTDLCLWVSEILAQAFLD